MIKVKSKVAHEANERLEQAMREAYEKEASRALNDAVSCPVHGNMELQVTVSAEGVAEVSGVACCEQGRAAVEEAIKA